MVIRLCKVFRTCRIGDVQRKEDACFFFSQVQSFKGGSTNLLRSECIDTESKGDDGFKIVNLHAVFVRQADGTLHFVFSQNFAFEKSLYPGSDCRSNNSEQLAEFPLGHGGCPVSVGRAMLPCPSIVMTLRFMALSRYVVTLPNDAFSLFPNIVRSLSSFCVVIFA